MEFFLTQEWTGWAFPVEVELSCHYSGTAAKVMRYYVLISSHSEMYQFCLCFTWGGSWQEFTINFMVETLQPRQKDFSLISNAKYFFPHVIPQFFF